MVTHITYTAGSIYFTSMKNQLPHTTNLLIMIPINSRLNEPIETKPDSNIKNIQNLNTFTTNIPKCRKH